MQAPDVFSVPRRFDMATVLVAMTGLALIYSLVLLFEKLVDSPGAVIVMLSGLLIAVTIGQALVINGGNPRVASVIAGGIYWVLVAMGMAMRAESNRFDNGLFLTLAVILGPLTGYLAGALVGGVFLIAFHLREGGLLAKRTSPNIVSEESPWDVDETVTFEIVEPEGR